jgi:hypothetical protein
MDMQSLLKPMDYSENFKDMNPMDEFVNFYPLQHSMNCCIYLESGHLEITKSLITLKYFF